MIEVDNDLILTYRKAISSFKNSMTKGMWFWKRPYFKQSFAPEDIPLEEIAIFMTAFDGQKYVVENGKLFIENVKS